MRTRGSRALKSKHFQSSYSLVPRIACPLLEANFVIAEHKQTCPPHALSSLRLLQYISTVPVQVAVNWLLGLLPAWPKKDLDLADLSLDHHYTAAQTSVEAQGWWEGGVKGCQGWIAGDGLQSCTCADIGSEAVQLCKKFPLSLDHPWSSYTATGIFFRWNKSRHLGTLFSVTSFGLDNVHASGSPHHHYRTCESKRPMDFHNKTATTRHKMRRSITWEVPKKWACLLTQYPSPVLLLLLALAADRTCA